MIRLERVCDVAGSDEHFATLNGLANGLFLAVSENLENISSFNRIKATKWSSIGLVEAEHLNTQFRFKRKSMWNHGKCLRNTANCCSDGHAYSG